MDDFNVRDYMTVVGGVLLVCVIVAIYLYFAKVVLYVAIDARLVELGLMPEE